MDKPVVARVHGAVAGFGLSLMNACDLAIAADDAYFAAGYRQIGISPDGGGTYSLPRIVGQRRALEILLLGARFDAAQALSIGLVNRVVPGAELDAAVAGVAKTLADGPREAIAATKRLVRASFDRTLSAQLHAEGESFGRLAGDRRFRRGRHRVPREAPRAVQAMTGLAGKTLFVTGGSRGIGLAIAVRAARDGANVAIAAKTDTPNPKLPGTIHTAAHRHRGRGRQGAADRLRHPRRRRAARGGRRDGRAFRRHRHPRQQRERDQPDRHRSARR